jgi:GH24 family phage-related lysozyme (muramidase)
MTFPLSQFIAFTESLEGHVDWMYLDIKGLVTIGDGNLIDPLSLAHGLVFARPDGTVATASEISAEWLRVKNRRDMAAGGGGAFQHITSLRATAASLAALVNAKVEQFEASLRATFPCWDDWPDDCQIAAMSMRWAMGDRDAEYPRWVAACRDEDWATAARECHMSEAGQNAKFKERNAANKEMFARAGREAVTRPEIV